MASELKKELTERFVKGIRRSFTPCPLIGPKWLQEFPNGKPADFRFYGIRKLAKAIGQGSDKILQTVLKNISFKGLNIDVKIIGGIYIDIFDLSQARQPEADEAKTDSAAEPQPHKPRRRQKRLFFRKREENHEEQDQTVKETPTP